MLPSDARETDGRTSGLRSAHIGWRSHTLLSPRFLRLMQQVNVRSYQFKIFVDKSDICPLGLTRRMSSS
jgi:hypothetical protein